MSKLRYESESEMSTQKRKQEHLDLCLGQDVQSQSSAGWDSVRIPHCALPDVDWHKISIESEYLGHKFSSPIFISSMTGGSEQGERLNILLAQLAQEKNIPMGVGSQRIALENPQHPCFEIRKAAPRAVLWANIGAVQLNYGVSVDDCRKLVDSIEASALILHLNPLQEAVQFEGDRNFANLWPKIAELKQALSVPLILKETGCGLDKASCQRAIECGVDALDSAGLGGTHWGFIEGLRHEQRQEIGHSFREWGIPSLEALENCAQYRDRCTVLASGGLRNGLDVAKALFRGAHAGGMALPMLKAAEKGPEALEQFYERCAEELKIALLCSNSKNIDELQQKSTAKDNIQ